MFCKVSACLLVIFYSINAYAQNTPVKFSKQTLTNDFLSEGVAVADINKDGKPDIFAGTHWFEAPKWKKHDIAPPEKFKTTVYSRYFLHFAYDVNFDGWVDLINVDFPGEPAYWFENPGKQKGHWKKHIIYNSVGNESPAFVDLNGDGRKELICTDSEKRRVVWLSSPASATDTTWKVHVISSDTLRGTHKFTHGLGTADMNLDGRIDVIYREGWWEAPADITQPEWKYHPANLGSESAQMYLADLDEDGDQDVLSSSAHRVGIWWHEQQQEGDSIKWTTHTINDKIAQTHSLRHEDINGDGHRDLITGKRYYAHNGNDPGEDEPAVLYWFEYKPGKRPQWTPHMIDNDSGAGLNFVIEDMNGDKLPDIVISNKKGVFVFLQSRNQ